MTYQDMLKDIQQATAESDLRTQITEQALSSVVASRLGGTRNEQHRTSTSSSLQHSTGDRSSLRSNISASTSPRLDAFIRAEKAQESGGNYGAVNSGSGAAGAYQIMPSNFVGKGGWDQEALGRNVSLKAFLNHPHMQDLIAENKFAEYFKAYGPVGAAKAWYAGPGNARTNSDTPQYGGPSINDYAAAVVDRMKHYLRSG